MSGKIPEFVPYLFATPCDAVLLHKFSALINWRLGLVVDVIFKVCCNKIHFIPCVFFSALFFRFCLLSDVLQHFKPLHSLNSWFVVGIVSCLSLFAVTHSHCHGWPLMVWFSCCCRGIWMPSISRSRHPIYSKLLGKVDYCSWKKVNRVFSLIRKCQWAVWTKWWSNGCGVYFQKWNRIVLDDQSGCACSGCFVFFDTYNNRVWLKSLIEFLCSYIGNSSWPLSIGVHYAPSEPQDTTMNLLTWGFILLDLFCSVFESPSELTAGNKLLNGY